MTFRSKFLLAAAILFVVPGVVVASPLFQTFGPIDEATFGGTGIPNDEVISSQFVNGDSLITIAMSATQRFGNPALTNDGAGTYFAGAGSNTGPGSSGTLEGALWNFNYYINIESTHETLTDYDINLFYDFDPAFDNGPAGLGVINITNGLLLSTVPATLVEDSQNLLFGFLATDFMGVINAPGGVFDPNAFGEYNFGIQVAQAGVDIGNLRLDVQVVPSAVPAPAAVWLFGSALIGFVGFSRRRKV